MRRVWWWLVGVLLAIAAIGGGFAGYLIFFDLEYSRARLYPDTGLDPSSDPAGGAVFVPRPGRVTLFLERGREKEPMVYDTGWGETIAVDIPTPSGGERIDLSAPAVRSGFIAYGGGGMMLWKLGAGGITGELEIEQVGPRRVAATYRIRVDAYCEKFTEGHRNQAKGFVGRTMFRADDPPHGEFMGYLWPRPEPRRAGVP